MNPYLIALLKRRAKLSGKDAPAGPEPPGCVWAFWIILILLIGLLAACIWFFQRHR